MSPPRKLSAHLGRLDVNGELFTVTARHGWIHFKRFRKHDRAESMPLVEVYEIARRQRLLALTPK